MKFAIFLFALIFNYLSNAEVIEPQTKHKYQDSDGGLTLAGVGVRIKKIGPISAKVYSAGLYVDKAAVSRQLKPVITSKTDSNKLQSNKEYQKTLIKGNFPKSLVLKMARTVGSDTMISALSDALKPRINAGSQVHLSKFESILLDGLQDGGAKNDMVLSFKSSAFGGMQVIIDGKKKGEISSKDFFDAFLGVYVDDKSVSPALRSNVANNIYGWF